MTPTTELDVIIVGAGFSGLYQLYLLRNQPGIKVKIIESDSRLGGIWFWNNYPGLRVDTVNPEYCLNIDEVNADWTWSEKFASRDEILRYLEHADKVLNLSKDIIFNTLVQATEFNVSNNTWKVSTNNGEYNAKFIILCLGIGTKQHIPTFQGLDSFQGERYHTSSWPRQGVDYAGKRVAVIGTGASGVQVIQQLAPQASSLSIFQRTPNLCLPMNQSPLDSSSQRLSFLSGDFRSILDKRSQTATGFTISCARAKTMDDSPEERKAYFEQVWANGGFHFWVAGYGDLFFDKEANRMAYDFWAEKSRARISDTKKRDILAPLTPPHAFGTKRPSLEVNYFEVCDRPNVEIVDIRSSPIDHFSSSSIFTSDGKEHGPFDIIVLATGYDIITGGIGKIEIKGKEGTTLKEKWQEGIQTYLGMTINGFPNLFIIYGPQTPTAFVNGPPHLSAQALWVAYINICKDVAAKNYEGFVLA